ncbi:DUF190 domain-containing protein [Marinilabilia rubra]|uniref:Uncharacterized protein n=1 Tax=Marinilabilia rubra TaxID=2162893 RepID=A0A2U2B8S8_9BACT|nr:DUF190 domain-containing protein [Marinilabilia rubra]PWD99446.1 hypothetical protein DDZ16_10590 [Marinilabilia rubra]
MEKEALALRIYISSTDKIGNDLLGEKLVLMAKEKDLAGATARKGIMGFGASSVIHSYKFWEVQEKVPLMVEIIDDAAKIEDFLEEIKPMLEDMKYGCMVVTEKVNMRIYKSGKKKR